MDGNPSNLEQWLKIALAVNTIGATLVSVMLFFWARERSSAVAGALLLRRVEDIEKRLERAGQKSSDLTDKIQLFATRKELDALRDDLLDRCLKSDDLRGEQIAALNVIAGRLQTDVARVEARLDERGHGFGRRDYDGEKP